MTTIPSEDSSYGTAIAIIGMSGRFPGARDVASFWQNIAAGKKSIRFFSDEELREAGIDPALLQDPNYVKAGTVIEDLERFDAFFFGYTPREAEVMDPQHRLFLECAWEALESAAYAPETYKGLVGVFAGSGFCSYLLNNLYPNPDVMEMAGKLQLSVGNERDSLASSVSYKLNLKGPSIAVQTFCSTSLVAVHLGCQSLLNYECDIALAGGVAITIPQVTGYHYEDGGIVSPDGECRTFDANAQGSVMSNGLGVVALKRLDEALDDGDHIYAVIRGSATNNDGSVRVGYTAPGLDGQTEVITEAISNAGVPVETLNYIEAHGTATKLGDAVELAAMIKAFRLSTDKKQFCAIGSVKPNIGHLDRASGVTGLIKTSMALHHRLMPPSLNFEQASPDIDLANSPFYVNTRATPWQSNGTPRRAGVSSFGLGGTNAHVVLEEAPEVASIQPGRPQQLLLLSAKTHSALKSAAANLAAHLKQHPALNLADVAYTLQVGRNAFNYRQAIVCHDVADALEQLQQPDAPRAFTTHQTHRDRPMAWMFAGVGEQYVGMGRDLYEQETVFRQAVDQCCQLALQHGWLARDLRPLLYPAQTDSTQEKGNGLDLAAMLGRSSTATSAEQALLQQTEYAQPAVFIIEYALAQLLLSWGLQPQALIGYSLGEYVAACVAGSLSLSDALHLVCRRAQLIAALAAGSMLAVTLSAEQVQPWLSDDVSLAIINSAKQCVLAGTPEAIVDLQQRLEQAEIVSRLIPSSHAFHSPLLAPVQAELDMLAASIKMQPPQIPYLSNVTGEWISEQELQDSHYWSRHMCQTVHFASGVQHLWQQGQPVFVEVGPGQSLGSFLKQAITEVEEPPVVVPALRARFEHEDDVSVALATLGKLWLAGVAVPWQTFWQDERRLRVPLPTYPFERQRYWIEAPTEQPPQPRRLVAHKDEGKKADPGDWFYQWQWQAQPLTAAATSPGEQAQRWLVLHDGHTHTQSLVRQLQQQGVEVLNVYPGAHFASLPDGYQLRPGERADYLELCRQLQVQGRWPRKIVHAWSLQAQPSAPLTAQQVRACQQNGLYSLLWLLQALEEVQPGEPVELVVLTQQVYDAGQTAQLHPEQAPLAAACTLVGQEYLHLSARCIDLALPADASDTSWVAGLVQELTASEPEPLVAYRAGQRFVPQYVPLHLTRPQEQASRLRQRGVYLITGGFGGVGLVLAEYLARHYQARLVLLGRSSIPPWQVWQRWQAEHGPEDAMSQRLAQLEQLEQLGAEILTLSADVADEEQMRAVIEQTYAHFGALHGVIHAAGISDERAFGAIQSLDRTPFEQHFQAKIYGLLALEQALEGRELDFCLLFSSLSAILGGLGLLPYAAANAFMDTYVQVHNRSAFYPWLSVNWDVWHVKENAHGGLGASIAAYEMSPKEGTDAFERVLLSKGLSQIINSTGDLQTRIRQWVRLEALQDITGREDGTSTPGSEMAANRQTALVPGGENYEQRIAEIWCNVLGVAHVGLHDNFFDLGGNSLIALQVLARIKKTFQVQIPAVALFEAPTVSALARYLRPSAPTINTQQELLAQRRLQARQQVNSGGIAIIGMTGRFPGADTIEQFWDNLRNGVESVSFFTEEELLASGVELAEIRDPNYVNARPILNDIEHFDAAFFGYSPREAELMDPQHRLFLECCWEALEHAGYDSLSYDGLIGVFGGANISNYMIGLMTQPEVMQSANGYQLVIGNDKDSLTTGVSYKLNLKGPSFAVQTFCSTSLVAVHLASQSLLNGESDIALAGGVSIRVPAKKGHLYHEGGMESPDGHCRTFDANAHGGTFGDGIGIVVLKRLSDAVADGDTIYAVIKGSAINNDGALKVSYTAPSVAGQAEVVVSALQQAGLDAESIDYIEAHGTATELGDPIEVASLTKAFRRSTQRSGYCAIGSVKTNIGHLDRAAGASGLIKTVLALVHEEIPASLHYQSPNPEIDFEHSPFFVNTQLRSWPRGERPRRAGINSLGMGGTNVHVVLEEAPTPQPAQPSRRSWHLLPLSARTQSALQQATANLSAYLRSHEDVSLADIAYTLQVGRRRFEHRQFVLCRDHAQAITLLEAEFDAHKWQATQQQSERAMAWMFAGVGEQYVGMGHDLYEQETVFRQTVDQCCELALQHGWLSRDLRPLLYPAQTDSQPKGNGLDLAAMLGRAQPATSPEQELLQQTEYAQPAVFIIEYALAQLLLSWGLRPQALIGYSLGEYVAACVAGSLSLSDALHLVCRRAQLIAALPAGSMLAVALSAEQVQPWLSDEVSLAIINGAKQCVLAGSPEAIAEVQQRLELAEIVSRLIPSSHAFHSPLLAPAQAELDALAASIKMQPPQIPYLSNVTGEWISEQDVQKPQYWSRHMCQTVHFAAGVQHLWQQGQPVFVELGPGQSLGSFLKQAICLEAEEEPPVVVPTLRARFEHEDDVSVALAMLGKLWLAGVVVPWQTFWQDERRLRVPLPTYPFERQRYWIEPKKMRFTVEEAGSKIEAFINNTMERKADMADWFYLPSWKQTLPAQPVAALTAEDARCWLIFADECGLGTGIKRRLESYAVPVITVLPGDGFAWIDQYTYRVHPSNAEDYAALLRAVMAGGHMPDRILHLWTVNADEEQDRDIRAYTEHILQLGFYSLISLVQTLSNQGVEHCQISLVSNHLHDVTGTDQLCPAKATILGPVRVIPQEYADISCRSIDVIVPAPGSWQEELLIDQIVCEASVCSSDRVIAFRGAHRWTQIFEPARLQGRAAPPPALREGGTYLILGGLGGIGQAIAGHLAQRVQARLVLTSRSGLPPRERWEAVLAQHGEEEELVRRIRQVQALEAQGAEILVLAADVTNAEQVRHVVEQTIETYGALHGVIHVAALPPEGQIQLKDPAMAARILAPKVDGTLILEQALQQHRLDFMLLFSSMSAVTGGLGEVDYCAANSFLDAFAHFKQSRVPYPVISINWNHWQWDAWAAGLAAFPVEAQIFFHERRRKYGITFEEGMEAIERVLAYRLPQVLVSPQDLPDVIAGIKDISIEMLIEMLKRSRQSSAQGGYARPVLGTPYIAPESEVELEVAAIWTRLLGIEEIGIHDNFFELGGHSLMGTQLMGHLRQAFQVNLPLAALFDSPTVAELALLIEATILEEIESMAEAEVENLV